MDNIVEIFGDAVVPILAAIAAFALLGTCCVIYHDVILATLASIFYK